MPVSSILMKQEIWKKTKRKNYISQKSLQKKSKSNKTQSMQCWMTLKSSVHTVVKKNPEVRRSVIHNFCDVKSSINVDDWETHRVAYRVSHCTATPLHPAATTLKHTLLMCPMVRASSWFFFDSSFLLAPWLHMPAAHIGSSREGRRGFERAFFIICIPQLFTWISWIGKRVLEKKRVDLIVHLYCKAPATPTPAGYCRREGRDGEM